MGRPAILKVDIVGDARGFGKAADDADRRLDKLSKTAGLLGKAAGAAALGGVAALGAGLLSGIKAAADYETLSRKIEGTIRSTGNAAGVSVEGVQKLAGSLEALSGIDEELILNGQNVLLTFTNIRNEAGKGNDIFNQASLAATNLSAALGQDMQSSATQLGKALNDPIKGVTALSRVGVAFTEQQKEQIKTLVESGDTVGAQKIILAELNKEFGNAAEAAGGGFNGAMAKVKDLIGDTTRELGARLLPILTTAGTWLVEKGAPAASRFAAQFSERVGPALRAVGGFITDRVVPAATALYSWFVERIVPAITAYVTPVLAGLRSAFGAITRAVDDNSGQLRKLASFLGDVIPPVARALATVLGGVLGAAFRVLGGVIAAVIGAISRLVDLVDSAVSKIRNLAGVAKSVGGALGKLNPFGGVQLLGGVGQLGGAAPIAPMIGGLATAAAGDPLLSGGGGLRAGLSGAGVTVVDRRSFDVTVRVDGDVLDTDGLLRKLDRAAADLAVRLGRASTFGSPA